MRYWLVVLAATLAACGGSSSSPPAQPVVGDTTPPVITLVGDNPQLIEAGEAYTELGATATDNIDGDLSASIVIDASTVDTTVVDDCTVTYDVSDSSGNAAATVTRTVTVQDTTPPVITLLGDDPQVLVTGDPYAELGATATDSLDGDLTAAIVIDASGVDTTTAGDYAVIYDVSDAAGNAAVTVTRTVRVQDPPLPAAPTVSLEGDIKQLIFSWDAVMGADYYRLLENADGHSGFTQVGDDIPAGTLTATRDIAVHLFDWVEAQYLVEACNIGGCNSSSVITAADVMLDTIGYIKASNPDPWDSLGAVYLSADGNTLAVGAHAEGSSATGINGDQTDNSADFAGAVYLFRFDGTDWTQQAYLKASNTDAGDFFGDALALSADGNTLVVGAYSEDSNAIGINGDQVDNSAITAGAVYLFRFDGTSWAQQAYIKASNTENRDEFGGVVALSADGNTLAVGADGEDSRSTGINGDQVDNSAITAGAVYLFRFDGTSWAQQAYIKASNTEAVDVFGQAVALSADGNTLAVGAGSEDSGATGINGEQVDNSAFNAGAVYLFRFDGIDWHQQAYIKASNTGGHDHFGSGVALGADGNTLAVGADGEDSSAIGINGDQADNSAVDAGAVYLFRFDGIDWHQQAYIKASNTGASDHFGHALALSADGNTLPVGAYFESIRTGSVYVLRFDGINWYQRAHIRASNSEADDRFGSAVALGADGNTLAVGADGEDSSATGINGDQEDNTAESAGAVYVY